jgi:hypothetical protein
VKLGKEAAMVKKVSLDTAFFRNLSIAAIDSLKEYHTTFESQLKSIKDVERVRIEENLRRLNLAKGEAFAEWSLAMDQHSAKYDMLFTNFFRYSFAVLVFLVFEDWLNRLCRAVKDIKLLDEPVPEPSRDIVKAYKEYLKRSGVHFEDRIWQIVLDFSQVRNCIVHTSGSVARVNPKRQHKLREIANRGIGIEISNYQNKYEHVPLYLENDMLMIQPNYLELVISDIKSLLNMLCDAIPLHELSFGSLTTKKLRRTTTKKRGCRAH